VAPNGWSDAVIFVNIPFMNQMMITALLSFGIILLLSSIEGKGRIDEKGIILTSELFKTSPAFNIGAAIIFIICVCLYTVFW
jgi:SSS family solute:Na+ symporter